MKQERVRRLIARAFLGYGVITFFFTFIRATNVLALTVGSLVGIAFLYLAIATERTVNFEKYAVERKKRKHLGRF